MDTKRIEVHLVQGKAARGSSIYAYLAIDADRVAELNRSLQSGEPINVEDYGVVLYANFGKPTEQVKRHIEETYIKSKGWKHESSTSE